MLNLKNLSTELDALNGECTDSALVLSLPESVGARFRTVCWLYRDAGEQERQQIIGLVAKKPPLQNAMLAYAYHCAEKLKETHEGAWLEIGAIAITFANPHMDPRDVMLAGAELYVTAEETGLDPAPVFEEHSPYHDFARYAVVRSRRGR